MLETIDLAEELRDVASLGDMTSRSIELVRRSLGVSLVNAVVFPSTKQDVLHIDLWSNEMPPDFLVETGVAALACIDEELGTAAELSARGRCFDVEPMFASVGIDIRKTVSHNEFWRPSRVERQALAYLGPPGHPIGFLCAARKQAHRAFTPDELRTVASVRDAMERALLELAPRPLEAAGVLLGLLSHEVPIIAAAFDSWGRVLWLTRAAAAQFGIEQGESCHSGGRYVSSRTLELWRKVAVAAIGRRVVGERVDGRTLAARVVESPGGPVVLLTAGGPVRPGV